MTAQEQRELEILEHIHANDQGQLNAPAELGPLFDRFGEDEALASCRSLRMWGLIEMDQRLSGGYHILPKGRTVVEAMLAQRGNRAHRRVECREQLLAWLDSNTDVERRAGPEDFEGSSDLLPFTASEVEAAITYLKARGYVDTIESWGGPGAVWITEAGKEAVDAGGVAEAERSRQVPQSVVNTFHMAGTGNVYATAAAPGSSATANVSNFNLEMAKAFATAIRASESDVDLDETNRADLEEIEAADQDGDLSLAQRATARLYDNADKITTGAVTGIVLAIGKQALGLQ